MIKCVKTIGDRRHLLIAKIECGRIFPVTKEKIGQYHKSKQTITMEKVRETVANILEEKLKPISIIQNRTNESANSNSQPLSPASKRKAEQPISDNEISDKEDANRVFGMHIFNY